MIECKMLLVSALEIGEKLPAARVIVIAPQEKAKEYAESKLKSFLKRGDNQYFFISRDLGAIMWDELPTTIFLSK